jgi:hypothetical protein
LSKLDLSLVQTINKISRQYDEIDGASDELTIDGQSKDAYVANFKWDEAKYAYRKPLTEIVQRITEVFFPFSCLFPLS